MRAIPSASRPTTAKTANILRGIIRTARETIDAIRALTGIVKEPHDSIARTNAALGINTVLI